VPGNYHDYLESLPLELDAGTSLETACSGAGITDGDIIMIGADQYTCRQRLAVMQEALSNSIDVNVGLMRFNTNTLPLGPCTAGFNTPFGFFCTERGPRTTTSTGTDGGTILRSVDNINTASVESDFLTTLNNLTPSGNTPLTESLYEAYRYYSGETRLYGSGSSTDAGALSGGSYDSPITNECQDNNIVLLSDGLPTADQFADNEISAIVPGTCNFDDTSTDEDDQDGNGGSCLDDLAGYMANTDLIPDADVVGNNPVFTYTIGFTSDIPLLQAAADAGRRPGALPGSGYFLANDTVSLEAAFRTVVSNIQSVDADTFVAPAVTVNAFNRLQNREDLYYLVFAPDESPRWGGNLKRYSINADAEIIDANSNVAVSPSTGFFVDTARSVWSETPDGAVVEDGGAAEQLAVNRTLLASLNANTNVVTSLTDNTTADPAASVARFVSETAALDIGQVGLSNDETTENRNAIAAWTIGADIDNERLRGDTAPNNYLGETLHGTPYVLSYGTSADTPEDIVFFTTNQGMLHAIDADSDEFGTDGGDELWSYIPDPDLLENLGDYYNRTGADHVYGLDAAIAFDVDRNETNNEVDKAYLYFGQRRGGSKYFAVDVTEADEDSEQIKKLFTIDGGNGEFSNMGQSWATPIPTTIRYCPGSPVDGRSCPLRDVLIISGGYDVAYDDSTSDLSLLAGNVSGNAIYIVDAQKPVSGGTDTRGSVLWMAGSSVIDNNRDLVIPEMQHSIPAEPTVLDMNGDGAIDVMFAVDIAGKVFRVDFNFGSLDTDGDGFIDIGSLGNAVNAGRRRLDC